MFDNYHLFEHSHMVSRIRRRIILNISILSSGETLAGTTNPGHGESRSNGNNRVLYASQNWILITKISLVLYQWLIFRERGEILPLCDDKSNLFQAQL